MNGQPAETDAGLLTAEVVAHIWREHSNCNWVSNGANVVWSCGIIHDGPIHMQLTTRDAHVAALVMTQVEADREIQRRRFNERLLNAADLPPCSQCGKPFTARACGFAHATIAADPTQHRLYEPAQGGGQDG